MTKDLRALFEREAAKHEHEVAKYTPPDAGAEDADWQGELSDEQLAELVKQMDDAFGPGVGSRFVEWYSGPMPDEGLEALQHIPDGFPATSQEFVESHETWRRLIGDKRKTRDQSD